MIRRHAGSRNAVTRRTIVHDTGVIENRPAEGVGCMADAAILIGQGMVARFALSKHPIMTGPAVINDSRMIECCGQESGG